MARVCTKYVLNRRVLKRQDLTTAVEPGPWWRHYYRVVEVVNFEGGVTWGGILLF
jgi:hypothetical protein